MKLNATGNRKVMNIFDEERNVTVGQGLTIL